MLFIPFREISMIIPVERMQNGVFAICPTIAAKKFTLLSFYNESYHTIMRDVG